MYCISTEKKTSFERMGRVTCGEEYLVFGGCCSLNTKTNRTETHKQLQINIEQSLYSLASTKVEDVRIKEKEESVVISQICTRFSEAKGGRLVIAIGAKPWRSAGLSSKQVTMGMPDWYQIYPGLGVLGLVSAKVSISGSVAVSSQVLHIKSESCHQSRVSMDTLVLWIQYEMLALPHSIAIHR